MLHKALKIAFASTLLVILQFGTSIAATYWQSSGSGNWSTGGNWTAGAPNSTTDGEFTSSYNGNCSVDTSASALNLTVSSYSGTITQNAAFRAYADYSQSSGTWNSNGQSFRVDGTMSVSAGTWTGAGASTVYGDLYVNGGTANVTGNMTVYGSVYVSSGTLNINGASASLTVTGSVSQTGGTLSITSGTLSVSGDISLSSGTFTQTSATIVKTGGVPKAIVLSADTTIYNLTISGDTYISGANMTVTNALTVDSSKVLNIDPSRTLTLNSGVSTTLNGEITSVQDGLLELKGTAATNFPTGGTLDANVRMNLTASLTVPARTYGKNLEIYNNTSSNYTATMASGSPVINGSITINAASSGNAVLDAGTNNPSPTVAGKVDFTGAGGGSESLTLGTGTWTVSGGVDFSDGTVTSSSTGGIVLKNIGYDALSTGLNANMQAVTKFRGRIVAGGAFSDAGGTSVNNIASWDGSSWYALGSGLNASVNMNGLTRYGSWLAATGAFTASGSTTINYVATWDGTAWRGLGTGLNNYGRCLTVYRGQLVVGGDFTTAGGVSATRVARWNGSTWAAMGSGLGGEVKQLVVYKGELYAGYNASPYLKKWNESGGTWDTVGTGAGGLVRAFAVHEGNLVIAGDFTAINSQSITRIATFDGSNFGTMGTGMDNSVRYVHSAGGYLVAGGEFTTAGGNTANKIAKWDGSSWSSIESASHVVNGITDYGGALVIGGDFTSAGGVSLNKIAKVSFGNNNITSSSHTVNDLTFQNSGATSWSGTITGNLTVNRNLSVEAASTGNMTLEGVTVDQTITVKNNLDFTGSGSGTEYLKMLSSTWEVQRDFDSRNGVVTRGSSTLLFSDATKASTIYGNNSFNNFRCVTPNKALTFEASSIQTMEAGSTITLTGSSGNLIKLRSTASGTQWKIDPKGTRSISYVDVKDSNNINASVIVPSNSISSGNNTNWTLPKMWTGAVNANWSNSGNWTPAGAPTATEEVTFSSMYNVASTVDSSFGGVVDGMTIDGYTQTVTLGKQLTVNGAYTQSSGTLTTSASNYTISFESFTLTGGTFTANASNVNCGGNFTISGGTFNYNTSKLTVEATNGNLSFNAPGYTFYDVNFKSSSSTGRVATIEAGIYNFTNLYVEAAGNGEMRIDTNYCDLVMSNDFDYVGAGAGSETVWSLYSRFKFGRNFDSRNGSSPNSRYTTLEVYDNSKISTVYGTNYMGRFVCTTAGKRISFEASAQQNMDMYLTLTGSAGSPITLESTSVSTQWNINPTGTRSVSYVWVKDSNNVSSTYINPSNSTNGGNTTKWFYGSTKTWSGNGNWSTGSNWTPSGVPTSTMEVVFNGTSVNNSTVDGSFGGTIAGMTIATAYTGTITMARDLTVTGPVSIEGGASGAFSMGANNYLLSMESYSQAGKTFYSNGSKVFCRGDFLITAGSYGYDSTSYLTLDAVNRDLTFSAPGYTFNYINLRNTGASSRIITLGSGTITAIEHLYLKADGNGGLTVDGATNNTSFNIGRDLMTNGNGGGAETLTLGSGTWKVGRNADFTGATFNKGTSTLTMDQSIYTGTKNLPEPRYLAMNGNSLYTLTMNTSTNIFSNATVTNSLTTGTPTFHHIDPTITLTLDGATLNLADDAELSSIYDGLLILKDSAGSKLTGNGRLSALTRFQATSSNITIPSRTYWNSVTAYSNSASNIRATLGSGTHDYYGHFKISAASTGALDISATNNPAMNIKGSLFMTSGGGTERLELGTNYWTVKGSTILSPGTVTPSTSIFTLEAEGFEDIGRGGFNGDIYCSVLYDGYLYVGGNFTTPGNYIAYWDGSSWNSLAASVDGPVYALAVCDGNLVAGGNFPTANGGGTNVYNIAVFDKYGSTQWMGLGNGFDNPVRALTTYKGYLIAGGDLIWDSTNTTRFNYIARWDGQNWYDMNGGFDAAVYALTVFNKQLWAGGVMTNPVQYLGYWESDSTGWQLPGGGQAPDNTVRALASLDGELYFGGDFTNIGGSPAWYIGKADTSGGNLQPLADDFDNAVRALNIFDGKLIVGGDFSKNQSGAMDLNSIALWDGASLLPIGYQTECGVQGAVYTVPVYKGLAYPAGAITNGPGGTSIDRIASTGLGAYTLALATTGSSFNDLRILNSGPSVRHYSITAGGTINGSLTMEATDTGELRITTNTSDSITIANDYDLQNNSSPAYIDMGGARWYIGRNMLVESGPNFAGGSSTVSFYNSAQNSYITGNITFASLECSASGKYLYFKDGNIVTSETGSIFSFNGTAGSRIYLRSQSPGNYWYINPKGTRDVSYVDVQDSYNINATVINPDHSKNSGNCVNWFRRKWKLITRDTN